MTATGLYIYIYVYIERKGLPEKLKTSGEKDFPFSCAGKLDYAMQSVFICVGNSGGGYLIKLNGAYHYASSQTFTGKGKPRKIPKCLQNIETPMSRIVKK